MSLTGSQHCGTAGVCQGFKGSLLKGDVTFLPSTQLSTLSVGVLVCGFHVFPHLHIIRRTHARRDVLHARASGCVFVCFDPPVFAVNMEIVEEERLGQLVGLSGKHAAAALHAIYTHLYQTHYCCGFIHARP